VDGLPDNLTSTIGTTRRNKTLPKATPSSPRSASRSCSAPGIRTTMRSRATDPPGRIESNQIEYLSGMLPQPNQIRRPRPPVPGPQLLRLSKPQPRPPTTRSEMGGWWQWQWLWPSTTTGERARFPVHGTTATTTTWSVRYGSTVHTLHKNRFTSLDQHNCCQNVT